MAKPKVGLIHLDFEVFGKVQGVFFRKYTQKKGNELGLRGWIMNTDNRTVKGQIEGDSRNVETMKKWLQTSGSPKSCIDEAIFSCEKEIGQYSLESKAFEIHR